MATTDAVKTALQKTGQPRGLKDLIEESVKELGRALPKHLGPERLVRIALTLIRTNPELSKCTPESFLGALFTAAQLGVEPVAGMAYILPFRNNRKIGDEWKSVLEAQFVLGYKGLASLFYRHEKAIELSWGIVHAKDDFDFQYGTSPFLHHKPAKTARGEVIGYYVVAGLDRGGKMFLYMSREDCLDHGKKHSKTYDKKAEKFSDKSPWFTSEDSMCLKTVLIQLGKIMPLSMEIQRAIQADESSRDYRKGIVDVLAEPSTSEWAEPVPEAKPVIVAPGKLPLGDAQEPN